MPPSTLVLEVNESYGSLLAADDSNYILNEKDVNIRVHFAASAPADDTVNFVLLTQWDQVRGHSTLPMWGRIDDISFYKTTEVKRLY